MTDDFGACVVLLPGDNDLPNTVEGGQHITLGYFGDKELDQKNFDKLLDIVSMMATLADDLPSMVDIKGAEFFGEEENAHVLTLDSTPRSTPVQLRKRLLRMLTPELLDIFQKNETFKIYRPHMTLGYTDEGYTPTKLAIPDKLPLASLAVWNGGDRIEFPVGDMYHSELIHYGTKRHSGRYAWGSGDDPQRNREFLSYVDDLRKQGMSDPDIAKGMGMTTTTLRAKSAISKNQQRAENMQRALQLQEKGMSNVAIGKSMGLNESSVRALLDPAAQERNDILTNTATRLKEEVAEKKYLDIGSGTENHLDISQTKLNTAVAMLREEGYTVHYVKVDQLGTGKQTTVKVLAGPEVPYSEVFRNPDKIRNITAYSEDGMRTAPKLIETPLPISSKRLAIKYAEDGGGDADGVIYIRPGVKDLSMGANQYAQVRIAVDGTHFLKGMAVYKDGLPPGVDMEFHTNKSKADLGPDKLKALKPMKDDPDNPFGSMVRQITVPDGKGGFKVTSGLNIVNDESNWDDWSRNLASQMLSKQSPALAKQQLKLKVDQKKAEFDEIMALTNPAVRRKLLEGYSESVDASAVHLKAAALPRQKTHVILPINTLKDDEVYAPQYRDGERVALVRYPHGGTFEIPELTVNNRNQAGRKIIGPDAKSAIGINSRVAGRLSGADFDGDTVIVIPNNKGLVKSTPALDGLKGFDPQVRYKGYEGMKVITPRAKQQEMGNVSNLITDMTIKGANNSEIARAVRHSMVVIDAEKHKLDYKASARDNGIAELKKKYQNGARSGASTIISRASSDVRVPDRKPRAAADGGPIDKETGKKVFSPTGANYVIPAHTRTTPSGKTVHVPEEVVYKQAKSKKMAETDDAYTLTSGPAAQPIERIYAEHANALKALGNASRKALVNTPPLAYSPSAKKAYKPQVDSLNAKLNVALKNSPKERQAQLLANTTLSIKKAANPDMEAAELKKIKGMALQEARDRVGAKKPHIDISDDEWEAIQAGAISHSKLNQILNNADLDRVKQLAMPRANTVMTTPNMARAKAMARSGYTNAEIADALGIPTSTINDALTREES